LLTSKIIPIADATMPF